MLFVKSELVYNAALSHFAGFFARSKFLAVPEESRRAMVGGRRAGGSAVRSFGISSASIKIGS